MATTSTVWAPFVLAGVIGVVAAVSVALLGLRRRRSGEARDDLMRVIRLAPSAIAVFDAERIHYANQSAADLLGVETPEELVGVRLGDILVPDTAGEVREQCATVQRCGELVKLSDFRFETNRGKQVRCDLRMSPIEFAGVDAVLCVLVPVDEESASPTLEGAMERFQRFFEDIPVPLYRTQPDGTIVHANWALGELLGIDDPADLVGVNAADFYASEDERSRLVEIQAREGRLVDHLTLLRGADGRRIWVRDSSHTVDDEPGQVFEGVLVDVTDGYRAMEELERRARQEEALAHISQVALEGSDVSTVFQEAAQQVRNVLNAECAMVIEDGESLEDAPKAAAFRGSPSPTRDALVSDLCGLVGRTRATGEDVYLYPESNENSLGGVATRLVGPTEPYGVLAVGGTGWKPRERDLDFLRAVAAMLGIATERAAARIRLERLMASKDEFIASVSHELRTPLTVVVGLADELESRWRQFSDAEISELVTLLGDQSREMSDLIEDLLVAARADIGKVAVHLVSCDLKEEISQVVAAQAHSVRERIEITGERVDARVDPIRFRQIVRNLVTNAIRYGGPTIRITIGRTSEGARVTVYDSGTGVPEEHRDRIFEPYERAHTSKGVPSSVGLGLTVSSKLTELMGGEISYHYEGGSVFELEFPAVAD